MFIQNSYQERLLYEDAAREETAAVEFRLRAAAPRVRNQDRNCWRSRAVNLCCPTSEIFFCNFHQLPVHSRTHLTRSSAISETSRDALVSIDGGPWPLSVPP